MTTIKQIPTLELLCDNTLAHVLSFLDFHSAVRIVKVIAKALSGRLGNMRHLWFDIFSRHCFAPSPREPDDYLQECRKRRQLWKNLLGRQRSRTSFNLPNRYFYFVPITPDPNDDWDAAPPVDFECPSFALTCPGTSGELVFLDPFDGSVVVQESCLDNAVASDEAMMQTAMADAAMLIGNKLKLGLKDVKEEHIAGAVIEESVFRNHNMEHYQREPSDILLDMSDYFNTDLSKYFVLSRVGSSADPYTLGQDEEVEIDIVGIDSKPILKDNKVVGTAVAVGRTLCSDSESMVFEPKIVSELIIWFRDLGEEFNQRFVCRVRSNYKTMDMDPVFQRVYFGFPFDEGPFRRFDADLHDEETDHVDFSGGSRVVAAYPMKFCPDDDSDDQGCNSGPQHFPNPEFILNCCHCVSAFAIAPGGQTILTSTIKGTIEIWETGEVGIGARRTFIIDVRKALGSKNFERSVESTVEESVILDHVSLQSPPLISQRSDGTDDSMHDEEVSESNISPVVTSFHFPSHCHIDRCGFITLNHIHGKGSWLLLWSKNKQSRRFELHSTVNIPLSPRRLPRVHYDGRRLVVFGQDHIGLILIIYQVLNSWEDLGSFERKIFSKGDESAGVHNLTSPPKIRFVNRIRHGAMGGMQFYDSAYMTCNERFIVVNTKTGNLLGGGSTPGTDGLLVIDLEELR